ncbi:MAG: XkdX family protein [Selenomonadaceae bacterium]|nr:XkdX family protein [Selenomonadaceae bacterium]MBO6304201.1 XkdX family protein [Selenomonadaceae bacterium]
MSKKFETVKENYDNGFWSKAKVRNAVVKNWITAAEYEEITGEKYE